MPVHITLTESDEPVPVPDCNDLLLLRDALTDLGAAIRAHAEATHLPGAWGAVRAWDSVVYNAHGAASWFAKDEGLIE